MKDACRRCGDTQHGMNECPKNENKGKQCLKCGITGLHAEKGIKGTSICPTHPFGANREYIERMVREHATNKTVWEHEAFAKRAQIAWTKGIFPPNDIESGRSGVRSQDQGTTSQQQAPTQQAASGSAGVGEPTGNYDSWKQSALGNPAAAQALAAANKA